MSRDGRMHPNSLKNLVPFNTESARAAQENSVVARKANKAVRDALKLSMKDWKEMKDELRDEAPSALDVLRIHMMRAIASEDADEATRLATILAEFEAPKLQRQDITQVSKTADLTDEELAAELERLGISPEAASLQ